MAGRSKTAQQAFELAEPVAAGYGLDLVDCEYKKEGPYMFLRVYIDKRGGIAVDDCELVSRALDPIFDEKLISNHDYFEVSSPGLDRPLKTEADFCRYSGEEADVSLFRSRDGQKKFTGLIAGADGTGFSLEIDGVCVVFQYEEVASCKRVIHFD